MRKLASIKTVSDIKPIEGRDRIVLATIDGWEVIVKKDEFQIGDLCVYIEIDSVMPEKPEFEFLRKNKFRIKTMRMAGVISQGIVFPMSILPNPSDTYKVGADVTEVLGVRKYISPTDREQERTHKGSKYPKWLMRMAWFRRLVKNETARGDFPYFIAKTDEVRIQNIPEKLRVKRPWIATEKIDGQSGTFCLVRRRTVNPFRKFEYMVCSRNYQLLAKDDSSYWSVSEKYSIQKVLRSLIGDAQWVAIQGECIAPKVQGNKYGVTEADMYVFNLIYPTGRMDSLQAKEICSRHGLKFVPIIATDYILPDSVGEVLEYAHGQSKIGDTLREGIVFRSRDGKDSFKAVDPAFLLHYDE